MKVLKGFAKNFSGYKRSWGSLVDLKIFKKKNLKVVHQQRFRQNLFNP